MLLRELRRMAAYSPPTLHNPYLLLRQSVKLVDQGVYLPTFGRDPALQGRLLVWGAGLGALPLAGRAFCPLGGLCERNEPSCSCLILPSAVCKRNTILDSLSFAEDQNARVLSEYMGIRRLAKL
jgi:hypothetical protein